MKSDKFYLSRLQPLIENGELTDAQAKKVLEAFAKEEKKNTTASTVMIALGIFLISAALITIIGVNFNSISITLRVALCFVPITITAILIILYILGRQDNAFVLYTSIFAPISIMATNIFAAQIYQVYINTDTLILICTLVYLPIALLLKNSVSAIFFSIASVTITIYQITVFNPSLPSLINACLIFLPMLILTAWFIYTYIAEKKSVNSQILFTAVIIILPFLLITIPFFNHNPQHITGTLWLYILSTYFLTLKLYENHILTKIMNFLLLGVILFSTAHAEMTLLIISRGYYDEMNLLPIIFTVISIGLALLILKKLKIQDWTYLLFAVIITTFFYISFMFEFGMVFILFILFNLIVVSLGVGYIITGYSEGSFKKSIWGILFILYIVVCRFISSQLDFGVKSVLFIAVGIAFIIAAIFIRKKWRL